MLSSRPADKAPGIYGRTISSFLGENEEQEKSELRSFGKENLRFLIPFFFIDSGTFDEWYNFNFQISNPEASFSYQGSISLSEIDLLKILPEGGFHAPPLSWS